MVEKIGGIGGSGPILTKRCLSRLLCQPKSSKWPRQPGHEQLWACPSHMSIASRARGCMRRLESRTSCANSQGFSRKADRVRRCRTDARSSSRSARPVAAAAAYLVRPERAADCRTPLPSPPLCHPSCGFHDPARQRKFALPSRPVQPSHRCCDSPCPPLLLVRLPDALRTCLRASSLRSSQLPRCRLQSPFLSPLPCRRRLRYA